MAYEGFAPPQLEGATEQTVGPLTLALVTRDLGSDGGPTIHVFGPVAGAQEEILRFDCFRKQPHYHLGISYQKEPVVPIDSDTPFAWVLDTLAEDLPTLLSKAGADTTLGDNWQAEFAAARERFARDAG